MLLRMAFGLVAASVAAPVLAQGLEGSYQGVFNALSLEASGGAAVVSITSGACLGYLEGAITQVSETRWEILGSVLEAPCTLAVDATADGRFEMLEGPGCTYYHGTNCELSGVLEKTQ